MDKKTFQNLKNNSKNRLPRLVVRRGWSLLGQFGLPGEISIYQLRNEKSFFY